MALHRRVKSRFETLAPETSGHPPGASLEACPPRDFRRDCLLGQ
jgi:hypothetical protein